MQVCAVLPDGGMVVLPPSKWSAQRLALADAMVCLSACAQVSGTRLCHYRLNVDTFLGAAWDFVMLLDFAHVDVESLRAAHLFFFGVA